MRRTLLLLLSIAGLGACYRYVPMTSTAPAVGTEVRAFLTNEGASTMASTLGRNVSIFDGRVLGEESNAWRMAVSQTRTPDDRVVSWTGEPVSVPRNAVARMELRVLDKPRTIRTAIFATIGGVALGLAIRSIGGAASGNNGGGGPPPP